MAPLLAERMADLVLTGSAALPQGFTPEAALAKAKPLEGPGSPMRPGAAGPAMD